MDREKTQARLDELKSALDSGEVPATQVAVAFDRRREDHFRWWEKASNIAILACIFCMLVATITSGLAARGAINAERRTRKANEVLQLSIDCARPYSNSFNSAMAEVLQSIGLSGSAELRGIIAVYEGDTDTLAEIVESARDLPEDTEDKVELLFQAVEAQRQAIATCSPTGSAPTTATPQEG